ncbi:MAG: SEC-C domain-containing protein [Acidobacteria bacterium]|nr:SEC-C domain-containing protein [Acidobacteriota bacterium]
MSPLFDPEGRAAVDAVSDTARRPIPARKGRARTRRLDEAIAAQRRLLAWGGRDHRRLFDAIDALEEREEGAWDWLAELQGELILDDRIEEAADLAWKFAETLDLDLPAARFAFVLAEHGPREHAIAEIERCLARFPHEPFAAQLCAEAWLELNEPQRAEALLRRALDDLASGRTEGPQALLDHLRRDALSELLPLLLSQAREDEARAIYRRHGPRLELRPEPKVVPFDAARAGRNDPCPCGSGRKFKRCCGAVSAPATAAPDSSALLEALAPFAILTEVYEDPSEVRMHYAGPEGLSLDDENEVATFVEWRALDLRDETGITALQRFAAWHVEELNAPARALIDSLDRSQLRLYEVRAVRPGEGLTLHDLVDGRTVEVQERLGSRTIQPWDLLAARIFESDGVTQMAGGILPFHACEKPALLEALLAELARVQDKSPDLPEADRWTLAAPVFHRYRAAMRKRPLPALVNQQGDPIVFSTARFDVRDAEEARRRLEGARGFVAVGRGEFDWLATRPAGLILGRVVLTAKQLRLETNSRERLTRGRALLQKLLGELIWHRGDSFKSIEQELARRGPPEHSQPPHGAPPAIPEELERQLTAQILDRHYRTWPDERIPALDGRTPRQAAKDPALRPRLVDLLRSFENEEAHGKPPGARYDFSWMWRELGLERGE